MQLIVTMLKYKPLWLIHLCLSLSSAVWGHYDYGIVVLCVEQNICATSRPADYYYCYILYYCSIMGYFKERGECETSCAMWKEMKEHGQNIFFCATWRRMISKLYFKKNVLLDVPNWNQKVHHNLLIVTIYILHLFFKSLHYGGWHTYPCV